MKSNSIYALFILCAWILGSCSPGHEQETDGSQGDPIRLTSSVNTVVETARTRAVSDFPNNGSIGIVATTSYDPTNPSNNWTNYADISNVEATATAESNGIFSFTWKEQKYWPFDGSDLYFMAYSPIAVDNSFYLLSTDNAHLFISLNPNIPDIMYASGNISPQPYNKESGVVNLGEFKHLFSRLTVQVVADAGMSETIVVTNLNVSTQMRSASFPLYGEDDDLIIEPTTEFYNATLVSGQVSFKNQPISNGLFLFPGTEDAVEVSITLLDTSNSQSYTANYMVSYFVNTSNIPVTLERAKNTVLTIRVLNIGVDDPDRNIELEGSINDWNYQGDFGVSIN